MLRYANSPADVGVSVRVRGAGGRLLHTLAGRGRRADRADAAGPLPACAD